MHFLWLDGFDYLGAVLLGLQDPSMLIATGDSLQPASGAELSKCGDGCSQGVFCCVLLPPLPALAGCKAGKLVRWGRWKLEKKSLTAALRSPLEGQHTELAQMTFRYTSTDPTSVTESIPHGSLEVVKCMVFCILAFNVHSFILLPTIHKQSTQTWFMCFLPDMTSLSWMQLCQIHQSLYK